MEGIVMSIFSKQEKEIFSALPEYMKQEAFFNCWTRKEAYTKAVGRGLSYSLGCSFSCLLFCPVDFINYRPRKFLMNFLDTIKAFFCNR
ncbi:MAG: 4'-phosphopantetheinyl transferase family protein [Desulfobacteria bacterium]